MWAVLGFYHHLAFSLHWVEGYYSVKEFSVFESAPEKFKKAVSVISVLLTGKALITLKSSLQNSSLKYMVVITN